MKTSLKILTGLLLALAVACGGSDTPENVNKKVVVVVNPSSTNLNAGEVFQFAAVVTDAKKNQGVTWSVEEGATGGSVTADGKYTAPMKAGTYHVVATSAENTSVSAKASVTVRPITVVVQPSPVSVATAGTVQLTASVTGTTDTAVVWTVQEASGGSVTATGVYTAPATAGTYHVVATSHADGTSKGTAEVSVTAVGVAITPASLTVATAGSQAFTAAVTGSANTAVTWSVQEPAGGAINSGGYYTAPATGGTFHVVATSVADPSKTATAEITVQDVTLAITPATTDLDQGASTAFTATVANSANGAVLWSVQEANGGQISTSGLYTAPAAAGTFHVVATSVADPSKSQSAAITVHAVQLSLSPLAATLEAGQVQPFTVTVTGTVNTAATFVVQETAGGTVDGSGSYTAPATVGTYHVIATSTADSTQTATATVTVPAAQGLTYADPSSTGWRLMKNAASTDSHLVLDLVGPAATTGKGVALTLNTNPGLANWAKVAPADTELISNLAYSVSTAPSLLKGVAKNGTLITGVFQKTGAAVDESVPVVSIALDYAAAAQVSGAVVPVSVVKAEALDATGALAPISVAVGTIKAH